MTTDPSVVASLARLETQGDLILKGMSSLERSFQAHVQQDHDDFQRVDNDVTKLKTQHSRFIGGVAVLAGLVGAFAAIIQMS